MAAASRGAPTGAVSGTIAAALAEDRALEYSEVFAFHDRDHDGKLTTREFADVVRALGYAPTDLELGALSRAVDGIYGGFLSFVSFVHVMNTIVEPKIRQPSQLGRDVVHALGSFEELHRGRSDGSLSRADLHRLTTRYGDALDEDAFMQMLAFTGNDRKNKINYVAAVDRLTQAAKAARA